MVCRLVLCASFLACLAALPLHAGEDSPRKRRGFDFGDPPTPPTETPEAPAEAGRPTDRSAMAIRADLDALRGWPAKRAQRAAESLFLRGAEVTPYLVDILKNGPKALQPGSAWVLGKVGEKVHIQVILGAAAKRNNASRAQVFFKAAYGLSGDTTRTWLLSFLGLANRPVFRRAAARFLADHLTPQDAPRVIDLLQASKPSVRMAGLTLLRPAAVKDADERLIQSLSDVAPTVCATAASLLGSEADTAMLQQLNELAQRGVARERAYATLALVEHARGRGGNPFSESILASLAGRRGLQHPDKLTRVSAALGLAYGAADARDEQVAALLDRDVVDVLVDGVGGAHFLDFDSTRPHAFAALRKLSGESLPETAVAWASWWRGERDSFVARRPLRGLATADISRASVQITVVEANGLRRRAHLRTRKCPGTRSARALPA